jgi:hypothetical protein
MSNLDSYFIQYELNTMVHISRTTASSTQTRQLQVVRCAHRLAFRYLFAFVVCCTRRPVLGSAYTFAAHCSGRVLTQTRSTYHTFVSQDHIWVKVEVNSL